jgi:hypothetical protein
MKNNLYLIVSVVILLACNFLTPTLPSAPKDAMVARHPSEWFPSSNTLTDFAGIHFDGTFSSLNEDIARKSDNYQKKLDQLESFRRILSYGYTWFETKCSVAKGQLILGGDFYVVVYMDAAGAQEAFKSNRVEDRQHDYYIGEEAASVGEEGIMNFYEYGGCDVTARQTAIMFRRDNVIGFAMAHTLISGSEDGMKNMVLGLARQLDQVILDETAAHPGTQADLVALRDTAQTIELPSETVPSAADLGEAMDYISEHFACSGSGGAYGTYVAGGSVTNNSEYPINITVEWGAEELPSSVDSGDVNRSIVSDTVRIEAGYSGPVYLKDGAEVITDNGGFPYNYCKVYSVTANWASP